MSDTLSVSLLFLHPFSLILISYHSPIYVSLCMSVSLCISLSLFPCLSLCVCNSSDSLSVCLSVCLPIYLSLSICLSNYLPNCLSNSQLAHVPLSVFPSVLCFLYLFLFLFILLFSFSLKDFVGISTLIRMAWAKFVKNSVFFFFSLPQSQKERLIENLAPYSSSFPTPKRGSHNC